MYLINLGRSLKGVGLAKELWNTILKNLITYLIYEITFKSFETFVKH